MTTWYHYIGGKYKNKTRFVAEAKSYGISRRVPAQVARGFHFGDRVILLRYHSRKGVEAFAEMRINEVIFEKEIAAQIGSKLQEDGLATYEAGSLGATHVHRECGDYEINGGWTVDQEKVDIPDLVKAAQELSIDTVFCMIGGKLLKVYDQPTWLEPAPQFTRGFIKSSDAEESFEYEDDNRMVEIKDYKRR